MSTSKEQGRPLTESALRQFVNRALQRGFVKEAYHSEHERAFRNISDEDVIFGLERNDWVLAKPPDYDAHPKHKTWEYLIKTRDIDGDELHLKIAVYPKEGRIKVITKF